jgi:hypothetical protein
LCAAGEECRWGQAEPRTLRKTDTTADPPSVARTEEQHGIEGTAKALGTFGIEVGLGCRQAARDACSASWDGAFALQGAS